MRPKLRHNIPVVLVVAAVIVVFLGLPRGERELPPEVTAQLELVTANPDSFLAAADSLLAHSDLDSPEISRALDHAAEAYRVAQKDSLLISDLQVIRGLSAAERSAWFGALQAEAKGEGWKRQGDHEASELAFLDALEGYRQTGDRRREAIVLGSIGTSWWYRGDLETAMVWYQRALYHRREIDSDLLVGRALNTLGTLNYQLWELDSALVYYELARDVRKGLDRTGDLATTLSYLGNVQLDLDEPGKARRSYLDALEAAEEDLSPSNLVKIHMGLASTFATIGDFAEALHHDRLALAEAMKTQDPQELAIVRKNLGSDLLKLERSREALLELRRAEQLQRDEDLYDLEATLNEIGNVYDQIGDIDRAFDAWSEAHDLAEAHGNIGESIEILLNLGMGHAKEGRFGQSEKYLDRVLQIALEYEDSALERNVWARKSDVRFGQGSLEESLEFQRKALDIDRTLGMGGNVAEDLTNIGMLETALGEFESGRKTLRESIARALDSGRKDMLWIAYMNLADNFEQSGQLDSAQANNARAISIIEQARSASLSEGTRAEFLAERAVVYEAQQHVLAQLHEQNPGGEYAEAALGVLEGGKSQALLEMLKESESGLEVESGVGGRMAEVERELRDVKHQLSVAAEGTPRSVLLELTSRQGDLERSYADLEERLRLEDPRFEAVNPGRPASLQEIRADLLALPGSILLEYSLGDSASYLWVITGDSFELHRLPPRPVIDILARDFLVGVMKRHGDGRGSPPVVETDDRTEGILDLYTVLLAPVIRRLEGTTKVYIVADGSLHSIPFEALAIPGIPEAFALQGKSVCYGPSATSLIRLKAMKGTRRLDDGARCLAVGDPMFTASGESGEAADEEDEAPFRASGTDWGRSALSPIPHTRTEVEAIAQMFPEDRVTVLLGEEARERTLMDSGFLSGFDVLHIATHGFANPNRPERSRLALSYPRDDQEDGYLQASEIYRLDLNAQLAVLSACRTGRGKNVRGEGVLGLPRAFFYAGVPNVIVSLWNVSDRATADLMTHLYREMIENGLSPGEALARAKSQLQKTEQFSHPFYWAAFVLMGPG